MLLSEPLGALSIAADLATGRPRGSGLTATVVSVALAKKLGMSTEDQKIIYFLAAVRYLGCTITSHETGMVALGDDQGFAVATMLGDWADPDDLREHLDRFIAHEATPDEREEVFSTIIGMLAGNAADFTNAHCRQSYLIAKRLPIPKQVYDLIPFYYTRWDGKILPHKGKEIPYISRVFRVSEMAELIRRFDTPAEAYRIIKAKAGKELDPDICRVFLDHANELFASPGTSEEFETFVAAEPGEPIVLTPACADALAQSAADMIDHKSIYFAGHSHRVSALSASAAQILKLPSDQVTRLRHAALVHDIGKCTVSNRIWYKSTALSVSERLKMEGHSYQTELILSHAEPFSSWSHIAASAQERADGSGYHRRVAQTDVACNILAAANEYDELTHDQANRKAISEDQAVDILNQAAQDRKFLPTAVAAVLQAAGHKVKDASKAYPFGLTRREAQVLSRLAKSETTAEIADALNISPKTADHHIQSIYSKTDTRGRPAIALLAMEYGIVMD